MKTFLSNLPNLLKLTYEGWKEDRASRLAAALAYYTMFSLAPLLVIIIGLLGVIWEVDQVRAQLLMQIQGLVGAQSASFIGDMISNPGGPGKDVLATLIGLGTLFFGALGVFNELHNSLNIIWEVEEEKTEGVLQTIKKVVIDRLLSFTMILGIGFLLLVSLVVSAGLSATQETIGNAIPLSEFLLQIVNTIISIAVITVLFALMYKFLPDAEIAWRDVWVGAFITSIFFSLGKTAIGLYLGNSAVASSFGAAGSLILLLVWIYYSAQILFFGAEFTQVYSNKYGSKIIPEGEEKTAQPQSKGTQEQRGRPALPAPTGITGRESQLERENRQTARVLLGLMVASFFTGIMTTIFGLKRRS